MTDLPIPAPSPDTAERVTVEIVQAEIAIGALPDSDAPAWDRPSCPAGMIPEFAERPEGLRLYAVLDGVRRAEAVGMNNLDCLDPELPAEPLFQTGSAQDAQGPWLVDLSRAGREWDKFIEDFFADHMGKGTGVFLRCTAGFDELRSHLRGLLKVTHGEERRADRFFRFWDPLTTGVFLTHIAQRPEHVQRFCFTRSGAVIEWYVEDTAELFVRHTPCGAPAPMRARRPLHLDPADEAALGTVAMVALAQAISQWIGSDYSAQLNSPARSRLREIGNHVVARGRSFGFALKDEFSYLAHLMVHFGGWFFETEHVPELQAILWQPAPSRHQAMQQVFPAAWEASPFARVAQARAGFVADLQGLNDAPFFEDGALQPLVDRHFAAEDHHMLGRLWQVGVAHAQFQGAPDHTLTTIGLLTLLLGYRFYEDPFVMHAPVPTDTAGWEEMCRTCWDMAKETAHG
ncbi:DUF4123 domain-containing protein [Alphaproteobacteria bacterium KMM 3653]|uniref:DUF4123 domain-containing protein n=1 Tax=Harenicola maris TaxID=2841044 RepID=A0AAP2CPT7_9RHOB|nr:DUF4123 domain-containing protein [Harenicola maris]